MITKKTKKPKKQRAKNYEKPLRINGTFTQAIKALVSEPKAECKKEV
jgi:hypothetical protein